MRACAGSRPSTLRAARIWGFDAGAPWSDACQSRGDCNTTSSADMPRSMMIRMSIAESVVGRIHVDVLADSDRSTYGPSLRELSTTRPTIGAVHW
jgi:hypothetical protein